MGTFKKSYLMLLVLSLLREEEMYGYRICQVVEQRTNGRYKLKEGVLYPLLHSLEKSGFIIGEWCANPDGGPERKYFKLTPKGKKGLEQERQAFRDFAALVPGWENA